MAKKKTEQDNVAEAADNKWQQMEETEQAAVEEKQEQAKASMADRSRESLENELVDLRSKAQESKDNVLRVQAEMQNLRRRMDRDMDNAYKFANEKLVSELLPIIDSLTRGIEAVSEDGPARQGMELTLNLLKEVIAKHGVAEINPAVGEAFNPQRHEAMAMMPVEGAESNTVAAVMQVGFELNGRVLRAAMVSVAK
jgi:molecular chaperone GrpE